MRPHKHHIVLLPSSKSSCTDGRPPMLVPVFSNATLSPASSWNYAPRSPATEADLVICLARCLTPMAVLCPRSLRLYQYYAFPYCFMEQRSIECGSVDFFHDATYDISHSDKVRRSMPCVSKKSPRRLCRHFSPVCCAVGRWLLHLFARAFNLVFDCYRM